MEEDALKRLNMLKQLNSDLDSTYQTQTGQVADLRQRVQQMEKEHEQAMESEETVARLREMEKVLAGLRTEAENVAGVNEKLRLQKEERSAGDLNGRVFAERRANEQAREELKEVEERRQQQRD